jgi:hypothetical protein
MRSTVLLVLSQCSLERARRFGGTFRLHHAETPSLPPDPAGFLLGLLVDSEDRGDVPPKRRSVFELHGVTTQRTVSSKHTVLYLISGSQDCAASVVNTFICKARFSCSADI